ncbi:MAG: hypothetical protein JWO32_2088 [Bacteroidetes bacterium]|nr:hypothetical protein [Bacteroidota bacterium]
MKKLRLAILVLVIGAGIARSQNSSLDVEGTILFENRTVQGALVSVTRDGKPFTSFLTDIDGGYNLYLPLGSEYIVTVTKKEFVKKMYTVSTVGIPHESAQRKFPVIVADMELLKYQDGVDYTIFNQPMNKYYFSSKKDNFEYDKAYLKYMLAQIEELKQQEKKAMALALQKSERDKRNAELAKVDAMKKERLEADAETLKKMQASTADVVSKEPEKSLVSQTSQLNEIKKEKPPVTDATMVKTNKSERIVALLAKYKPGITEEIIPGRDVVIIQRVVVRDEMAWVYQKKLFSWGGVACFRDGFSISESAFDHETKKHI